MAWLKRRGCRAVGMEVPCPVARFRVDAAGYAEEGLPRTPRTIVVECKATRADFLRDDLHVDALLLERQRLLERKQQIEAELIPVHEPHLRRTDEVLFAQAASWEFQHSRLLPYRRVLRQLTQLETHLHGQTKFDLVARWRLANELWLLAPSGVVRAREVPPGWGLAECSAAVLRRGVRHALALDTLPLHVRLPAPSHDSPLPRRMRLLRNIAIALTRRQYPDEPSAGPAPPPPADATA